MNKKEINELLNERLFNIMLIIIGISLSIFIGYFVVKRVWLDGCDSARGIDTPWYYCNEKWAK